jgi:hypothetical protein
MDGELVPWEDAQVHVLTHGLHYGTGVLEGSRVHATRTGPAAFRLNDHLYASLPKSYRGVPVGFSAAHVVKTGTNRACCDHRKPCDNNGTQWQMH